VEAVAENWGSRYGARETSHVESGLTQRSGHMDRTRSYKAVGIFLLVAGAAYFAVGLSGGQPASFRIIGPVLAFLGVVLLTQAKRRNL
jgi:hypothetical protein